MLFFILHVEKAITISGNDNWSLQKGAIIIVKFSNTNTASSCTLNVNNTGAKTIVDGHANKTVLTYSNDGYFDIGSKSWQSIGKGEDNSLHEH